MVTVQYVVLQILVIIALAPLVNGIIKKVKALTQKRKGAPVLQLYFDLYKLLQKESVVSEVSSWVFTATPYIVFTSALLAALLVPVTTVIGPLGLPGDLIMLVYILALGKFFMALSGLDTGSTFGGMGSSREVMISAITEPAMMVALFALGVMAKSTSIFTIMTDMTGNGGIWTHPALILIFLALLIIIIAETSRIPVDDPATHLELTMVHEAMILEYSGRHLALMEMGAAIKQLLFITLMVNIFFPCDQLLFGLNTGLAILVSLLIYVAKVILTSLLIAVIETSSVKISFFSVPNLAALSFILSFVGFLQYFLLGS